MIPRRRAFALLAIATCLGSLALPTHGAPYPERPIRLIIPFAPAGSTDIVARLVADRMQHTLGQAIVVENRAGAGGSIGADALARATPDGYTIGIGTISTLAVNPVLLKTARPDPLADFAPVTALTAIPSVSSVHPGLGVKDFAGLVDLARTRPDALAAGSSGSGSIGHVILEAINGEFGLRLQHIPYKGMGPVINGALSGETQVLVDQYPSSAPHIQAGKLVPLAVASAARLPDLPHVPTYRELGHPALNDLATTWFGLVAPAGTPPHVVARLNEAARLALEDPGLRAKLESLGAEVIAGTPDAFAERIRTTLASVRQVVQDRNIRVE